MEATKMSICIAGGLLSGVALYFGSVAAKRAIVQQRTRFTGHERLSA